MERVTASWFSVLALLFSQQVFAYFDYKVIKPNFGIDLGMTHQDFDQSFGEDHFSEHHAYSNFYVGAIFCKYLGVELGYEHLYRQQRPTFYTEATPVLGFLNPLNTFNSTYFADVFTQSWHVDLLGIWPICPQTQLTASIGVAWAKMYFETLALADPLTVSSPVSRWQSDHEALLRLGVGIRQMITKIFGARFQAIWENSSQFSGTTVAPLPLGVLEPLTSADNYTAKAGNHYSLMVGFFFQFT